MFSPPYILLSRQTSSLELYPLGAPPPPEPPRQPLHSLRNSFEPHQTFATNSNNNTDTKNENSQCTNSVAAVVPGISNNVERWGVSEVQKWLQVKGLGNLAGRHDFLQMALLCDTLMDTF